MTHRDLERWIRPLRNRVLAMVARAVVQQVKEGKLQLLQVSGLKDEGLEGLERFQEYGFTSHPHPGAEAAAVFVMGDRSHGIVIAVDDRRYRLQLQRGEVALYDDLGQRVKLARDGIEISAQGKVTVTASGDVEVTAGGAATLEASGDVLVNAGGVVNLGGTGGPAVARVGDSVSSGTIVSGSSKVFAAG